jgi:CIC family chloride channel protein
MSREIVKPSGEVIGRPKRGGLYMWALALPVGIIVALLVALFGTLVTYAQFLAYGAAAGRLSSRLLDLAWWSLLIGPIVGGAVIALLLRAGTAMGWGPAPRPYSLPDVIQNRRLRGTIKSSTLALRDSFLSAAISIVSLGWGGSAGREEPVAHLGASIGVLHGRLLGLDVAARRMLLAMGVAAAIAASLHTPIAAVLLASEMILRRVRLTALGPVVVAAVGGWLVSIWLSGGRPLIALPDAGAIPHIAHLGALMALPLLILFGYMASVIWARAPVVAASTAGRFGIPLWTMPVIGGVLLGIIALAFPQVLGVGFEPLAAAIAGNYGAEFMPVLLIAKIAAAAATIAFRWGGGPIAPALFVGAMAGSSLAVVAGLLFGIPAPQVYLGVLGMAICVAVLLDAPFAAAVLALELSGSPEIGGASLLACFIACMAVRRLAPMPADETGPTLRWR